MTIITLDHFEPFDGMKKMFPNSNHPYINCTYNYLLSLARYFEKSEIPILSNNINLYKFDISKIDTIGYFKIEVRNLRDKEAILNELGILSNKKSPTIHTFSKEILSSLSLGKPLTLDIDLYYQKGREFYYNKKHGLHPVIVCGFDSKKNEIHIIDDITEYKRYNILFSEFEKCCSDTLANNGTNFLVEYSLSIQESTTLPTTEYVNQFVQVMQWYRKDIFDSLSEILSFSNEFNNIIINSDLIETLSSTIYRKSSEKYRINTLYNSNSKLDKINAKDSINFVLDRIISDWTYLRNILLKASYANERSDSKSYKTKTILRRIYDNEIVYNNLLFKMLDKY
ncbi:hypothetical protein [Paenibacillus illinoisensis]|uniref:hypothetical protein n=1 Tax=Paenibacillus illinoisensis TaxID=59845 RepID=UPI001C8E923F|nr:hypothetical protein [Paenibacillus illinoisensis]MBY0220519.1 hypothetical protein [Paenibacillus illinoisensis]